MEEREKFADDHLEEILDSGNNPINGKQWWKRGESPWQLLASCIDLAAAFKLSDPTKYKSNLPIHQDGSCNGLQHYAALGGDIEGGKAVNLVPCNKPGDVYTGVADKVQELVNIAAEKGSEEAKLMINRINRKLVKQTVMVYNGDLTVD